MTENWTELILGIIIVVSPWVLGFSDVTLAKWCNVLLGLLLIIINAWTIFIPPPPIKEEPVEKVTKHKK